MAKEKTYEDYVADLKKLYVESNKLYAEKEVLEDELSEISTFEKMQERFGKFGKVEKARYDNDYVLNIDVNDEKYEIMLASRGSCWSYRNWYCDNLDFGKIFNRLSFNAPSVEEINTKIANATALINSIIEESKNGNDRINNITKSINKIDDRLFIINCDKTESYENAKSCFIRNKYGTDGTSAPYFLKDKKNKETLGLVKIIKKEDSGLGFTVEDVESGRRYYHVEGIRLKEDLRDFPSKDVLGSAE